VVLLSRHALAKAESDGSPLPFNKFISIDAPQQNALFARDIQDYMEDKGVSGFQKHGLDNDAAKQILTYNTYGNLHNFFYFLLNNLNGTVGYPTLTENIGVAFSNNMVNTGNGRWIVINYESIYLPGTYIIETSWLDAELKVPGSYLPKATLTANPYPKNICWFAAGMANIERDPNNSPTFIPYNSALDIVNGNSRFNTVIYANNNYFHDEFPPEVVSALISKFLPLTASISGPNSLTNNQSGTWNASALGGNPPYHYQ